MVNYRTEESGVDIFFQEKKTEKREVQKDFIDEKRKSFTRVHGEMLLKWHWKEKGLVTPPPYFKSMERV